MRYRFSIRTLIELTAIIAITISFDRAVLEISALREFELLFIAGLGAVTGIYIAFRRTNLTSIWKLLMAIVGWTGAAAFLNTFAMAIQYGIDASANGGGDELAEWYWSFLPACFVAAIAVVMAVGIGAIPAVFLVRRAKSCEYTGDDP
jgi:hypothetical protein